MSIAVLSQDYRSLARECSGVDDFSSSNLFLTAKLLKQGYRYRKFEKHFLNSTTDTQELIVCKKGYQNLYFMVIWFVDSNELLERLILVINPKRL